MNEHLHTRRIAKATGGTLFWGGLLWAEDNAKKLRNGKRDDLLDCMKNSRQQLTNNKINSFMLESATKEK